MQNWVNIVVSILSGLAVCIPLVYKLVVYVTAATKEKNWNELIKLTIGYMTTAETKFKNGADRKEWVLAMVKSSADSINYPLDDAAMKKIGDMIDNFCTAAKTINGSTNSDKATENGVAGKEVISNSPAVIMNGGDTNEKHDAQ